MTPLESFFPIAEAMAKLLHPYAEVVVHDVASNQIAAIFNNVSQREVGDDSLLEDLVGLEQGPSIHGPFLKETAQGQPLKYISTVLRDTSGQAIGLMCVNMDLGPLRTMQHQIQQFLAVAGNSQSLDTLFEDDWQEKVRTFVETFLRKRNLNRETLRREDRVELVVSLQEAGAFRAKNAMAFAARIIGVSRATLYNDLARSGS